MLTSESIEAWQAYFRWQFLHLVAGKMHNAVADENFRFWGTVLSGQTAQQPRWKRVMTSTESALGDALGQLYVQRHFSEEAKNRVNTMVDNLVAAYSERIDTRDWMSADTKKQAHNKLNKIMRKLAFPDKWRTYSGLNVSRKSYVRNFLTSNQYDARWLLGKFGKPVDKTEWGMTPATINAYYNQSYNEIVFPAAILQPPFYDYKADEAVNYGGIGAVIGHEISHGFDDEGATFNADGNLVDWWTADDLAKFTALGGALADQYSALEPLPGIHVDGKFTLGENIGDLGGINAAYDGLQLFLKENGNPGLIDGYTPEQRLFISWATIWRSKIRDEALKNQVKTDPHSPGMYRAYVPLTNLDTFFQAFDIKEGDGMYVAPDKRVKIW